MLAALPHRWCETHDGAVYSFEGDCEGSHAHRRIIRIEDARPLAAKQCAARIPAQYQDAGLVTWNAERANPGARQIVEDYLGDPRRSIYVHGAVGTGKTWVACTIANELLQRGESVKFQSAARFFLELRRSFTADDFSELDILEPHLAVGWLVLDDTGDVGVDRHPAATCFVTSRLLELLGCRYAEGKATIITSNLSLTALLEWSRDERVPSRVRGMCGESGIIELGGRDLRFDREAVDREVEAVP